MNSDESPAARPEHGRRGLHNQQMQAAGAYAIKEGIRLCATCASRTFTSIFVAGGDRRRLICDRYAAA
jgi:hypothetical protein